MIRSGDYFRRYLRVAPTALAFERAVECEILAEQEFRQPLLDIGCGDGIFAEVFFAAPIDTGIDPDPKELQRAADTGAYAELIACRGDAIPKPDQSYPTIVSNSVLEHIPNPMPVLEEAHRLLKPGGRFYLTIPTDRLEHNSLPARILNDIGLKRVAGRYSRFHNRFWQHYNAHSPEAWRSIFEEAGFTVVVERRYASAAFSSFYDVTVLFALPSLLARRFLGRWFLFPALRPIYSGAIYALLANVHTRLKGQKGESLVFYALTRE